MSHGSLFTGVGLLDLGLVLAGLPEPAWVCERDAWRRDVVLARRFPRAVRRDDVRTVGADTVEPVRLVVGGFPCKGASTAGKRNGFDHPETVLWREMDRAVRELRPEYVLLENVANLLALGDGAVWGEVLGTLASLGFDVQWDCIPAAAVGAPHRRDRVFAVATHPDGPNRRRHGDVRGIPDGRPDAGGGCAAATADASSEHREAGGAAGEALGGAACGGPHAAADADDGRGDERAVVHGAARGGVEVQPGHDPERRGVRVEWGAYGPAIRRWERASGTAAPEPLVRRMDDGGAARVERSRLSALGDGVQVQVGRLMGDYLLSIDPSLAASTFGRNGGAA